MTSGSLASVVRFVFDNSILLVAGTLVAVAWANLDTAGYDHATHPLHFWVNDVGMVFFFALAAKEVFEATLPGGPMASLRQAASPLAAAIGGMVAPALIFIALTTVHRPRGAEPRLGDPVRDRHRLLGDDRARHLPGRTSGDSVPAPAGHRRRRDGPDRAGRLLSLGLALVPGAGRPDERRAAARVVAADGGTRPASGPT